VAFQPVLSEILRQMAFYAYILYETKFLFGCFAQYDAACRCAPTELAMKISLIFISFCDHVSICNKCRFRHFPVPIRSNFVDNPMGIFPTWSKL